MPKPLIWIAGDHSHGDFAVARCWLAENTQPVPAADDNGFPRAILVFQSRPGQVSRAQIEALSRRAPLARVVLIQGAWLAGQRRQTQNGPGVTQLDWLQAPRRLWAVMANVEPARRNVTPLGTTSEADALLRQIGPALRRNPHSGSVAVCTSRRGDYQALADACSAAGWLSSWRIPGQPPKPGRSSVWIVDGWSSLPAERIAKPALLLLDFPRPDDIERAAALGIWQVLARPLFVPDLLAALDSLAGRNVARTAGVA